MTKVSINLLTWNNDPACVVQSIRAVLAQEFDDFELVYSDNGSSNGLLQRVQAEFGTHPRIRIVDNRTNLGYAGGHNKFFAEARGELVMVLNPDAYLDPRFLGCIVPAFDDPRVAAATGKMLDPGPATNGARVLDGTGIRIGRSRRACERGQWELDGGQYDGAHEVFGVSGTAAVYRRAALERIKLFDHEYFDEDFFAYWEDLDLSWRLRLVGYECRYVPGAIVWHSRAARKSPGGYRHLRSFVQHHRRLPTDIVRWSWRNHLFAIIKNDFGWTFWRDLPMVLVRECAMLGYILLLERRALGAVPAFLRLLPRMLEKRRLIQSRRQVSAAGMQRWFV